MTILLADNSSYFKNETYFDWTQFQVTFLMQIIQFKIENKSYNSFEMVQIKALRKICWAALIYSKFKSNFRYYLENTAQCSFTCVAKINSFLTSNNISQIIFFYSLPSLNLRPLEKYFLRAPVSQDIFSNNIAKK